MENENPLRTLGDYSRPSHEGYRNTSELPDENKVKVLVKEEVNNPITKYVNVISLVRIENDKGTEGDKVFDKNVVEPIELVNKEKAMDEETNNESNRSENEDLARWGKYADRLLEMPRLYLIRKVRKLLGFLLGRLLDDDLAEIILFLLRY
nr:hypothetical protein [Tanacetum cinerariifolium]